MTNDPVYLAPRRPRVGGSRDWRLLRTVAFPWTRIAASRRPTDTGSDGDEQHACSMHHFSCQSCSDRRGVGGERATQLDRPGMTASCGDIRTAAAFAPDRRFARLSDPDFETRV